MFLDSHERLFLYLNCFLNVVPESASLSILGSMVHFGVFILFVALKDRSDDSSPFFPQLDIIDRMPEVAESALVIMRRLYLLVHSLFRKSWDRDCLEVAKGFGRICIATKANNSVPEDEWLMSKILLDEYDTTSHHGTIIESIAHARASHKAAYIDEPQHLIRLSTALRWHHRDDVRAEDLDSIIALMESAIATAEKKDRPTEMMGALRRELSFALSLKATLASQVMENGVSGTGFVHPGEEDCSPVHSASTSEYVELLNLP